MSEQRDLFGEGGTRFPPASRRDDPETSRIAEEKITKSGVRGKVASLVLKTVRGTPGLTGREVEQATGRDGAWKRLSDLERLGFIEKGEPRSCSVTGHMASTWVVTEAGRLEENEGGGLPED